MSVAEALALMNDAEQQLRDIEFKSAAEFGLDPRAGTLYYDEEADVLISCVKSNLDYYGAFEYIDSENITVVGNYRIFHPECERVQDCIDFWRENNQ